MKFSLVVEMTFYLIAVFFRHKFCGFVKHLKKNGFVFLIFQLLISEKNILQDGAFQSLEPFR